MMTGGTPHDFGNLQICLLDAPQDVCPEFVEIVNVIDNWIHHLDRPLVLNAGNGWEWGLLGLLFMVTMDHSLIPY